MKHGMKTGKKRSTSFYNWLSVTVFHKAMAEMKLSHDDKRITQCVAHRLKRHEKPGFIAPVGHKPVKRGK
jgi:hypothetical protein